MQLRALNKALDPQNKGQKPPQKAMKNIINSIVRGNYKYKQLIKMKLCLECWHYGPLDRKCLEHKKKVNPLDPACIDFKSSVEE